MARGPRVCRGELNPSPLTWFHGKAFSSSESAAILASATSAASRSLPWRPAARVAFSSSVSAASTAASVAFESIGSD